MTGIERIVAERKRQIEEEGFTAEYDAQWKDGELPMAAAFYAACWDFHGEELEDLYKILWRWTEEWYKPSKGKIRCLEKAGATIAAEIDRLLRMERENGLG
jgi:hypothetical protein